MSGSLFVGICPQVNYQIRSEFDEILLQHVADCGVKVFQETRVTSIDFEPPMPSKELRNEQSISDVQRPIAAQYTAADGE